MIRFILATGALLSICYATYGQAARTESCFNDVARIVERSAGIPAAASALRTVFTPLVVPQNSATSVLFEVTTAGTPSAVNLFLDATQTNLALNDNGTNGDKKAKDGIYSAVVAPPKGTWTEPFVGYTRILENGTQTTQINTFIGLLTSNMPLVQPKKIDNATQYTDYVFNIVVPTTSDVPDDAQKTALNQLFYKYHADEFDFINYVLAPGHIANRFHGNITNVTQGTGMGLFNNSAQFGSKGRLLGYEVFPVPDFFDGANKGYIHEIGHQWINQLSNVPFLKEAIPHWPVSNLAAAVMGLSIPVTKAGGDFPYTFTETSDSYQLKVNSEGGPVFNQWELYLMGLIPASEVTMPAIVFKDQNVNVSVNTVFPKSAFNTYTINDLIAQAGARTPTPAQSQKRFNVATLLLSEQRLLTTDEISYFDYMARRAEGQTPVAVREGLSSYMGKPFLVATGNRASLRALLNTNVNCVSLPPRPTITTTGNMAICDGAFTTLTASASDTYIWYRNGVPLTSRTNSLTVTQSGNYALSVRNATGCNSILSSEVEITTASTPAKPTLVVPNGTDACVGSAVTLQTATGGITYRWFRDSEPVAGVQTATFSTTASGSYAVAVQNASGCFSPSSDAVKININPLPAKPTISVGAGGLTSSSTSGNQWLLDGKPIPNATGPTWPGTGGLGAYSVRVTINGCSSVSDALFITATEPVGPAGTGLRHAPNPVMHTARISFDLTRPAHCSLRLLTAQGVPVRTLADGNYPDGTHTVTLDTTLLPSGLYLYQLEADGIPQTRKLVILK